MPIEYRIDELCAERDPPITLFELARACEPVGELKALDFWWWEIRKMTALPGGGYTQGDYVNVAIWEKLLAGFSQLLGRTVEPGELVSFTEPTQLPPESAWLSY